MFGKTELDFTIKPQYNNEVERNIDPLFLVAQFIIKIFAKLKKRQRKY